MSAWLQTRCWIEACKKAGFPSNGRSPAAQIEATIEPLAGAEFVAVNALLSEAGNRCLSLDVDGAADCLSLAVAMVEQAGRVCGALRAVQGVEDAFWPVDLDGRGHAARSWSSVDAAIRLARLRDAAVSMVDNGFGPQTRGVK